MGSFWKKFGAHVVGGAMVVLPLVQQYAGVVPGWGTVAAQVAGGLLLAIHAVQAATVSAQPSAAAPVIVSSTAKVLPLLIAALLVVSTMGLLSACASLNAVVNQTSTEQTLIQDGVKAGVMAAILTQPASGQKSTAQGIIAGATAIEGVTTDSSLTISQLQVVIAQRLALTKLDPLVQGVLNDAISAVVTELAGKISTSVLSSGAQTTVNTLMGWIIAGATPYAGS